MLTFVVFNVEIKVTNIDKTLRKFKFMTLMARNKIVYSCYLDRNGAIDFCISFT